MLGVAGKIKSNAGKSEKTPGRKVPFLVNKKQQALFQKYGNPCFLISDPNVIDTLAAKAGVVGKKKPGTKGTGIESKWVKEVAALLPDLLPKSAKVELPVLPDTLDLLKQRVEIIKNSKEFNIIRTKFKENLREKTAAIKQIRLHELDTKIKNLRDSFFGKTVDKNYLLAIDQYYAGSSEAIISAGQEMIYAANEIRAFLPTILLTVRKKVDELAKMSSREILAEIENIEKTNTNLKTCSGYINEMCDALANKAKEIEEKIENHISRFVTQEIVPMIKKIKRDKDLPKKILSTLEKNFPQVGFMVVDWPSDGKEKVVDHQVFRAFSNNRHFVFDGYGSYGRSMVIFWRLPPKNPEKETSLINKDKKVLLSHTFPDAQDGLFTEKGPFDSEMQSLVLYPQPMSSYMPPVSDFPDSEFLAIGCDRFTFTFFAIGEKCKDFAFVLPEKRGKEHAHFLYFYHGPRKKKSKSGNLLP